MFIINVIRNVMVEVLHLTLDYVRILFYFDVLSSLKEICFVLALVYFFNLFFSKRHKYTHIVFTGIFCAFFTTAIFKKENLW